MADKVTRIAWLQKMIEDLDSYLSDDGLDLRVRHRYTREIASMLKAVAEEKGELRTQLDVTTTPLTDFDVIAMDENGNFHGVADH